MQVFSSAPSPFHRADCRYSGCMTPDSRMRGNVPTSRLPKASTSCHQYSIQTPKNPGCWASAYNRAHQYSSRLHMCVVRARFRMCMSGYCKHGASVSACVHVGGPHVCFIRPHLFHGQTVLPQMVAVLRHAMVPGPARRGRIVGGCEWVQKDVHVGRRYG